jgi:predicted ATPase
VLDEFGRQPPVIAVLEDLHWADEATLDLVKFLGRRIQHVAALLVLTYRDDELGPRHPLRIVLGDLATASAVRLPLPPLSVAAVRALAANQPLDAEALHRQTGGNPFFVTEALAARAPGIPPTVGTPCSRGPPASHRQDMPRWKRPRSSAVQVEPCLLGAIVDDVARATDECIAIGMLQSAGDRLGFRHELARQAILDTIAAPRRRVLHAQVLEALTAAPAAARPT